MSENVDENVENPSKDFKKHDNNRYNKFASRKPRPRFSNNNENYNNSKNNFDVKREENMENDQRRSFGKPFTDRIEDKIAQLSYNPTVELPAIDLTEKPFGGKNRIYIANIGNDFTEEDLKHLFEPYGESSEIFLNKDKHFAFVKLEYYANAQKAQRELDGVNLKGKILRMKISPSCAAVKVKNLNPTVTNELLYHAFSVFGEIESAKVLVDDKGKSTGEGIIYFTRKVSATIAIQKCKDKCYFLTYSLKPVIVEHHDYVDQSVGLLDKHFTMRNFDFQQERSTGPRLAETRSFDHEYGSRWKALYDLCRQKEEAVRIDFRLECEKLEAQMEFARFEHETEALRDQLRRRELDKDRQKREYETKERLAEEERVRAEAQIRHAQKEIELKLARQQDAMKRRQDEEANLLLKAQNLTTILDTQEIYDVPTSSTRDLSQGHYNERDIYNNSHNGMMGSRSGFDESTWNNSSNTDGHWVREDTRGRGHMSKKRRF